MAETRVYGRARVESSQTEILSTLQALCDLQEIRPSNLEIRTVRNPLTFGATLIDPESSSGVLYMEHYSFKMKGGPRPKLVFHRSDGKWYEYFRQEMQALWDYGTEWKCKTETGFKAKKAE